MTFIVILISLSIQWFSKLRSARYQLNWVDSYCRFMQARITSLTTQHGWVAILFLVAPIILITSVVFTLVYHGLGHLGYLVLSLVLLWYCMDVRAFLESTTVPALLLIAYQRLFVLLFWYSIFGPIGLILYVIINELHHYFLSLFSEEPIRKTILSDLVVTQSVLDWVPVRLLGLTFALAGHFSSVFNRWITELFHGISTDQHLVITWGEAAMQPGDMNVEEAKGLIYRSLIIWLVVMALVSLGFWIG